MKTKTIRGWVPGNETEQETLHKNGDCHPSRYITKKDCLKYEGKDCKPKKVKITYIVEHEKK